MSILKSLFPDTPEHIKAKIKEQKKAKETKQEIKTEGYHTEHGGRLSSALHDVNDAYGRLLGSGWEKISKLLMGKPEWTHLLQHQRVLVEQNRAIIEQNGRVIKLLEEIKAGAGN